MSLLNLLLPTHAKVAGLLPDRYPCIRASGQTKRSEIEDTMLALHDMVADEDWPAVRRLAQHLEHLAKLRQYERACGAEGVVRR